VWTNATALPFFQDFDVVLLCDVIEHVDDDVGVLVEAGRVLRPGGSVVVTVPAGPDLWTRYDEVTGHKRRYTHDGLVTVIGRAGLILQHIEYFNCLPLAVQRVHRRLSAGAHAARSDATDIVRDALMVPPRPLNDVLRAMMRFEAPLRGSMRGGSLIALAHGGRSSDPLRDGGVTHTSE
jgi:SAM-dependent methyltransferase